VAGKHHNRAGRGVVAVGREKEERRGERKCLELLGANEP